MAMVVANVGALAASEGLVRATVVPSVVVSSEVFEQKGCTRERALVKPSNNRVK